MGWISNIIDSVLRHINRTFHRTTCASECYSNRCECTNEGESASEEVSIPPQPQGPEPDSNIIFTSRFEVRRLGQSSATPPPPPHH